MTAPYAGTVHACTVIDPVVVSSGFNRNVYVPASGNTVVSSNAFPLRDTNVDPFGRTSDHPGVEAYVDPDVRTWIRCP